MVRRVLHRRRHLHRARPRQRNGREEVRAWIKPTMEEYGDRSTRSTSGTWSVTTAGSSSRCRTGATIPRRAAADRLPRHHGARSTRATVSSLSRKTSGRSPKASDTMKQYGARVPSTTPSSWRKRTRRNWGTGPSGRAARRRTQKAGGAKRKSRAMPEMPQMQALAERLDAWLDGATFTGYEPLGFTGLKTYDPPPEASSGATLRGVDRQASTWCSSSPTASACSSTCRRPAASTSRRRRRRRSRRARSCG